MLGGPSVRMLHLRRLGTKRNLATSAQKRALNKQQVEGPASTATGETSASEAASTTTTSTSGAAAAATTSPPSSSSAGGGSMVPMLIGGSALLVGGVLYAKPGLLDGLMGTGGSSDNNKDAAAAATPVVATETAVAADKAAVVVKEEEEKAVVVVSTPGVSVEQMASMGIPSNPVRNTPKAVPAFEQMEGHRVSVEGMNAFNLASKGEDVDVPVVVVDESVDADVVEESASPSPASAVVVEQQESSSAAPPASASATDKYAPNAMDAAAEVFSNDVEKSAIELAQLRAQTLRLDVIQQEDLNRLEDLSPAELRFKVLQLISSLSDSARHEAVRLKEYAAIAEKQTAEKYLEILQKQRLEFENLLAAQLRDKEDSLARKYQEEARTMKTEYETFLRAQLEAQQAEFEQKWNAQVDELTKSYDDRLEVSLADGIAKNKDEMIGELTKKLNQVKELSQQLEILQQKASISATFEQGSQAAHRTSAAALALAGKFETSQSAVGEMASLKTIVGDSDSPITVALSKIPAAASTGVPTLPELQNKFEKVKSACRQAAMVPDNSGLGGQLLGYVFASMSIPPPVDELVDGDSSDHILARAHHFVQVGDLERAIGQLDQLKGQAAFVVHDWKEDASARVLVDQAVRVIKMECALMNKSMGGSAA
mmetsp:Transcript_14231/g.21903  ORF Transcript_14231/g.21903 Transcript_14231/m.21903 type:complete len:656 (-) Transcript_14231:149-2116(-)|eukprot:CAMPEP_0196816354 /NCGR_PEP_ID=MMETSP1362-20130617/54875_1 /TAXON_ID=163516 /ORGANISM="Leptocylindrus danicus, Strain CCMP1856" /LENGTH=655 /DNA_ID=CAMNT_0042193651 /DNA_START=76 /DNA_END=2043 /DNA_ORIENTATION=+